jgi:hypothetical protein
MATNRSLDGYLPANNDPLGYPVSVVFGLGTLTFVIAALDAICALQCLARFS